MNHHIFPLMILLICLPVSCCTAATDGAIVVAPSKLDQSVAIRKALNKCASDGGGTVMLAPGKHRLDKPVVVPSGVTLAGVWAGPHHAQLDKGSVVLVYASKGKENDPPLIKLSPNSTVRGLTFYYPEQTLPKVIPYPWTIQGEGMHGNVLDITLVNAYNGIDFGTHPNELHHIRNVYGCILNVGVYIDKCTDIGRVENVHFNHHYWVRAVNVDKKFWDPLFPYSYLNTTAFKIGRADWEMFVDTFSIATKIGYHFIEGAMGSCNGSFVWGKIGTHTFFTRAILCIAETASPYPARSPSSGSALRREKVCVPLFNFIIYIHSPLHLLGPLGFVFEKRENRTGRPGVSTTNARPMNITG